jgi:multiple sugar transport system permease protein
VTRISSKAKKYWGSAVLYVSLLPYIFPFYWMIVTSLKSLEAVYAEPPQFIPVNPTLSAYLEVADQSLLTAVANSFIIATGVGVGTLLLAVPAAFALSRFTLHGSALTIFMSLALQVIPAGMLVLPMFLLMRDFNLVNSYFGTILAVMTLTVPFAMVMLRPMFASFPLELEEAARIDGASTLRILVQIATPVLLPAILTIGGLSFMFAWGEFVYSLTLMQSQSGWPVTVLMSQQITEVGVAWDRLMAVSLLTSAPLVILYLFLQRHIREGITAGAVKG